MKYKPGDKVKIRADLNPNDEYGGLIPVLSMCGERGNVATIKNSEVRDGLQLYRIEGDMCNFLWTGEMFEKITDKEKAGVVMKYKVGDKVLVRNDLEYDKYYSDVRFDKDMEKCRGGQATITKVYEKYKTYRIDLDRERFMWGDDMFEGLVSGVKKVFSNKTTPATKYKVGDKVKIREDLHLAGNWRGSNVSVIKDMVPMAGKTVTITAVRREDRYDIEEDNGRWVWHESMFEGKVIPIRVGVSKGKVDIKTEEPLQEKVAEMFGCQLKKIPQDDAVSHPSHYTDGRIEVIDFIQDKKLDFCRGNVVKYISRAGKKGGSKAKELEDLKKARQYCDFAIRQLEGRV